MLHRPGLPRGPGAIGNRPAKTSPRRSGSANTLTLWGERVIASADCGFATLAFVNNAVAPSVVWAKLAALAEGARIATSRLWQAFRAG